MGCPPPKEQGLRLPFRPVGSGAADTEHTLRAQSDSRFTNSQEFIQLTNGVLWGPPAPIFFTKWSGDPQRHIIHDFPEFVF